MKRLSKGKGAKAQPGAMAYFLTIGTLVVISAYSHVQFRAEIQDQAFRSIAMDQKKTIQFSQINSQINEEPSALSAPAHLKGVALEAKNGKKPILRGDPP